jgi:methyl-accepting chemotaxis protein
VAKAVKAMSEINNSSKKIADIIGVIDEIAFQTNLLALNAAVEAARAGEQGRGFAVVASEVRNLAGRSATAAKEIKALIRDSVQKVDEGSTLVAQSGQTLEHIVGAVKKVSDIIAEIAASSQEQSSGIEQVNKAVMELDEMTQQNAALVEQATAASKSLSDQSRALSDEVSQFQFKAQGQPNPVAAKFPATEIRESKPKPKAAPKPQAAPKARSKSPASAAPPLQGKNAVGDDSSWQEF